MHRSILLFSSLIISGRICFCRENVVFLSRDSAFTPRPFIAHQLMQIQEIARALENFAPLPLQEGYDNAGLQIGITGNECSGALLCLDVTEAVIEEASRLGFNLIVAHHPLLFRGVKCVSDSTQVQRCIRMAVQRDIAIYAAHTNLDNARGGVNFEIAKRLGLKKLDWLSPIPGKDAGSGLVGELPQPVDAQVWLKTVKEQFGVEALLYTPGPKQQIQCIALCGGAGEFLIDRAAEVGADLYLTGEIGYHHFFGHENELWLAALGHYQSERFTIDLLERLIHESFPDLPTAQTSICTNPIHYL